ncbi:hypothetical protein PoB_007029400 [Plakobranchus ocellatus]|uniref:Uncharacterized protein n=1 Tax=Plakobranchus ocellatus TaxID=259542 RepID=A0AAV4DHS6_9GAST|nr:hypothetical protein PoB_007029400 [Plakobranchus ocellatus]
MRTSPFLPVCKLMTVSWLLQARMRDKILEYLPSICFEKLTSEIRPARGRVLKNNERVKKGKFEGKRSRGRQREKIMDGLATWLGTGKVLDTLAAVKDRDIIANAYKQGT